MSTETIEAKPTEEAVLAPKAKSVNPKVAKKAPAAKATKAASK